MNYNIDNESYNILFHYLQYEKGYTPYQVKTFLTLDPGRIRETLYDAELRLCEMCYKTIMFEGYLHEGNSEVYCEECGLKHFTNEEREQLYDDDMMCWTEFHGY